MARPPVFPAEEKVRVVLSILAGEITVAEAARRPTLSHQSVGQSKTQYLESDKIVQQAPHRSRSQVLPPIHGRQQSTSTSFRYAPSCCRASLCRD